MQRTGIGAGESPPTMRHQRHLNCYQIDFVMEYELGTTDTHDMNYNDADNGQGCVSLSDMYLSTNNIKYEIVDALDSNSE